MAAPNGSAEKEGGASLAQQPPAPDQDADMADNTYPSFLGKVASPELDENGVKSTGEPQSDAHLEPQSNPDGRSGAVNPNQLGDDNDKEAGEHPHPTNTESTSPQTARMQVEIEIQEADEMNLDARILKSEGHLVEEENELTGKEHAFKKMRLNSDDEQDSGDLTITDASDLPSEGDNGTNEFLSAPIDTTFRHSPNTSDEESITPTPTATTNKEKEKGAGSDNKKKPAKAPPPAKRATRSKAAPAPAPAPAPARSRTTRADRAARDSKVPSPDLAAVPSAASSSPPPLTDKASTKKRAATSSGLPRRSQRIAHKSEAKD